MTNKEIIDKIISDTFEELRRVYFHNRENMNSTHKLQFENVDNPTSRLLFPCYNKTFDNKDFEYGETRISEQELRFLFVELLITEANKNDWYYSVETPTRYRYVFSADGKKSNPHLANMIDGEKGESAMIDLAIYDKNKTRIALIEFKALNPESSCFIKDFEKLQQEPDASCLRFFIHIIKNYRSDTFVSIRDKMVDVIKNDKIQYRCYCLEKNGKLDCGDVSEEILNTNKSIKC